MARHSLPLAARKVWQVAMVVRGAQGFVLGISLYTWGPLLYEQFLRHVTPDKAITFTTFLFGLESVLGTLLEVPTGAFGDAAGRKWSVVYSFACIAVGNLFLAYLPSAESFATLLSIGFAVVVCFALYATFFSGSFTAWCIEQLRLKAPGLGYDQVLAPAQTTNAVWKLLGALVGIGGYASGWSWVAFLAGALAAGGCCLFCLGEMQEPELHANVPRRFSIADLTTEMGNIIGVALRVVRRSRVVAILVLLFACYLTLVNFVGLLWPIYVRSNLPGAPQVMAWLGLAVITQLAEAGGSHRVTRHMHHVDVGIAMRNVILRRLLIGGCVLGGIPVLGMSLGARWHYDPLWAFLLTVLCVRIGFGIIAPAFETLLNNYLPHSHARERSTILSLSGLWRGILVFLLAIPASGPSGEKTTVGWLVPAAVLLVVTLMGWWILSREEHRAPQLHCEVEPAANSEEATHEQLQ